MIELNYKRNLNSKIFDTGGTAVDPGSGETVPVYATQVQDGLHYAENGQYKNIDTNILVQAKYEFSHEVTKMRGIVRYGDTSANPKKHLFGVEDHNDNWLNVKLDVDNHTITDITGNKIVFSGQADCDVNHYTLYNGVKTEYTILDKNVNSYTVTFKHNDEVVPEQRGNKIVFVRDGKDIFTVKSPFAYDAAVSQDVIEPVVMTLGTTGGFDSATMVVDATWLLSSTTPIIDPDVTIEDGVAGGLIADSTIISGVANDKNYGGGIWLKAGESNDKAILLGVDLSSYIGLNITYSKFSLYQYGGAGVTANWYRVLRSWGEGVGVGGAATAGESSYSHYSHPSTWTTAGCKGDGTDREATTQNAAPLVIGAVVDWIDFECLNASVIADLGSIFSILIEADPTANVSAFRSNEYGSFKPTFYMEYTEGTVDGKLSGFSGIGRLGVR